MTGHHWTATTAFAREISKALQSGALTFSQAERDVLVARAARDIERLTPILAARERDRLFRMPNRTDRIQ